MGCSRSRRQVRPPQDCGGTFPTGGVVAVIVPLAAGLLPALPAQGQEPATGDLAVRAEVHEDLSVFHRSDLAFGTLVAGQGWETVAVDDDRAGQFRIVGQQNRDVEVTLDPPAALENGAESLPYDWEAAYNNDADDPEDPAAATSFEGSPTATFQIQNNRPANEGEAFIWVHGRVDAGTPEEPAVPGSYQATFTATVVYP